MDILIARPDSSGIGGMIALILLLALLAGEYYLLTVVCSAHSWAH